MGRVRLGWAAGVRIVPSLYKAQTSGKTAQANRRFLGFAVPIQIQAAAAPFRSKLTLHVRGATVLLKVCKPRTERER
jgi:hypothetical protein